MFAIPKCLTGTYEGGYTYVFEMCCYRTMDIVTTTHLKYIRVTSSYVPVKVLEISILIVQ